jgi:two-component sensor histidine kinase
VFIRATGVAFDITGRKLWEERQRLLINELNHRVKNTLATVQSIAAQTFRDIHEESRPKLKAFEERLFALARAHDVLTRENWEGAKLHEIITEVLEPYRRLAGERFEIRGPRQRLNPSMALPLAMALHELATNASKYGALSVPRGRVSIHWTLTSGDSPTLILEWRESHGPSVLPPTRRGFGTRLIERSLASDLGGHVRLIYDPSGVICRVEAPLKEHGREEGRP